ncbi:MAG TPA: hypothetical protein VM802_10235 [Chitinophaga sp.]|uniref:hypothetical protein n=1 Tax=Chitinophaga sp. TaxID=1869181 RepID=UPI002D02C4F6|nr:hypothetical protein [Chitinophaga sp.]HVI45241.1 hypothetical protein [Chitinophaga sp.]
MNTTGKILAGTAIGAGVIVGISYFKNIKRASVQLEVVPKAYLHSLDLSALKIRVDALLKNPTRATFSIKFPYIRIMYQGALVGSSQVINKDIRIPAFGMVVVDGMMVEAPVLNLLSVTTTLAKDLKEKKPITFDASVITTVNLGWSRIPFETKQQVTLKK